MRILEDKFSDLKEQQHKILFGQRDNEEEDEMISSQVIESSNPLEMTNKTNNLNMLSP
jgi:hypothetical protein